MNKREQARHLAREKLLFRYSAALERGDFAVVAIVLQEAERDSLLEGMILEINKAFESELGSVRLSQSGRVQPLHHQSNGLEVHIHPAQPSQNGWLPKSSRNQEENDMLTIAPKTLQTNFPATRRTNLTLIAALLTLALLGGILFMNWMGQPFRESSGFIAPVQQQEEPYAPEIDPANFVAGVDNPYFPLVPGTTWIYGGEVEEGMERIEVSVLPQTKEILGIAATVVRDSVWLNGELIEDTYDWYAQDSDGNVWYMGEETREYENGIVTTTAGAWEAGVDGALPGIIMQADPQIGDVYRQEYYVGEAEDVAEVVSLTESASVAFGEFDNLVMTREWSPLQTGVAENKYYAAGVGQVLEVMIEGGSDRIELIDVIVRDVRAAQDEDDDADEADDTEVTPGDTPLISADEALAFAQAEVGTGTISEIELLYKGGQWIYVVEVGTEEVLVDAITGAVLEIVPAED